MKTTKRTDTKYPDYLHAVSEGRLNTYSDPMTVINFIHFGIRVEGLQAFAVLVGWELNALAKVIGTTKRALIQSKTKRLNKQISENALEVARLCEFGTEYFGSVYSWNQWLCSANLRFNYQTPHSVINSIRGRELIRETINASRHGFVA